MMHGPINLTSNETVVTFENLEIIKKNQEETNSALIWEMSVILKFKKCVFLVPSKRIMKITTEQHGNAMHSFILAGV